MHVHCPDPCCMTKALLRVHVHCMSMSILHVHVYVACPKLSMSMLHVHVDVQVHIHRNAGLSSVQSARYRNEKKWRYRNRSGNGLSWQCPAFFSSGTGLNLGWRHAMPALPMPSYDFKGFRKSQLLSWKDFRKSILPYERVSESCCTQ